MAEHSFYLTANWPGLRNDVGTIETAGLSTKVSIPPEMDGPGVGTNPDEMLLGAAATCYIITVAAMLERSKIPKVQLTMESEGIVEVEAGVITYKKIIHRPIITLFSTATVKDEERVLRIVMKAEQSCMISRALAGNVDVHVESTIKKECDG